MIYPVYFSALLRTEDGRLLETGEACLSRTENKVTFRNEFVPLVKIDETVEIVRVLGNRQLEAFRGRVYLSSRNLLQIVDVDPQLISQTLQVFDINTYMSTIIALSPNNSPLFNLKKADIIAGTIRYLSMDVIKLSVLPYVGEGQYMKLECDEPPCFKNTVVRVEKRELLGRNAALLLCSIVSQPHGERAALKACADELAKLDEDVDTESDPPELDQSLKTYDE